MERILLAGAIYLLAVQPSFAQAVGSSLSFRGFVLLMLALGGAYWGLAYYFKNRQQSAEAGFQLPYAVWFILCALAGVAGNIFWMQWTFSIEPGFYSWAGPLAVIHLLFGWLLPLFVMATAQMFQSPSPSFGDANGEAMLPTLGGYYFTFLWANEIFKALDLGW